MSDFLTTVETDLKEVWVSAETFIETEAVDVWNTVKAVFLKMLPSQWVILQELALRAAIDVATGNIADIETALLNQAEVEEIVWVKELGSEVLQAVIAILKVKAAT